MGFDHLAAVVSRLGDVPFEFVIFGLTLAGVAMFHHRTLLVAVSGLAATIAYKLVFSGFGDGVGLAGLQAHFVHEGVILSNLLLLLLGFALLANQFERSGLPDVMPRILPDGWTGGLALLAIVFALSAFLDNIAAAIIGGVVARHVYRDRVSIAFLASIVAAANAGGAGSVLGDTTTTMMWISGVSPLVVLKAFIAAGVAFLIFGTMGAIQQHFYQPIQAHAAEHTPRVDRVRVGIVVLMLATLLVVNFAGNAWYPQDQDAAPWLGIGLWVAILVTSIVRMPQLSVLPGAAKGALFLVSLVATASLMPVETLPTASPQTAFGLGFLSSVFDNIPLTALALRQGGYDWGVLAFAVGFGGSMMWFGSSAGVALSGLFPKARSVGAWLLYGWHVPVAYVCGFVAMSYLVGWHPTPTREEMDDQPVAYSEPPPLVDDALRGAGEWMSDLSDQALDRLDEWLAGEEPAPSTGY